MKIKDKQTFVMTGDSITDCGRARPVGRRWAGLGSGYVSMVDSLFGPCCPEISVDILNTGISGDRVPDLEARWQPDVLELSPDWLSILIGINDVWRLFDHPTWSDEDQVSAEKFEAGYRRILERTRPEVEGLVMMAPYFLEPNKRDPMRAQMDEYGAIVCRLAGEFDAIFVDLQAAFDRYLKFHPSQVLCGDRVHPNGLGHMIIATSLMNALGGDWKH